MNRVFANNKLLNAFYEWHEAGGLHFKEDEKDTMPGWLQEAEGSVDFPVFLASKVQRVIHETLQAIPGQAWRKYTKSVPMSDFRPATVLGFDNIGDLLEIKEKEGYVETSFSEENYGTMTLSTYGRSFAVTRQMVINDDLGKIMEMPQLLTRAAMRTLAKKCAALIASNPTLTNSGVAMFYAGTQLNLGSSALSESTLSAARLAISKQTDAQGEVIGFVPKYLVIPPDLEQTAERILFSQTIPAPGTGLGDYNVLQNKLQIVVDPYLTDTNDWYVFADPAEAPAIKVGFLNGKDTPDVILADPSARLIAGAEDPYSFGWDEIRFKVRFDFTVKAVDWRGTYKAVV